MELWAVSGLNILVLFTDKLCEVFSFSGFVYGIYQCVSL